MLQSVPVVQSIALFYRIHRHKGFVAEIQNRKNSSLLFCLHGKLKFVTDKNEEFYVDKLHPIYVPAGSNHQHFCVKDCECILFDFYEQTPGNSMANTAPVNEKELLSIYAEITALSALPSVPNQAKIISLFYQLLSLCAQSAQIGQNRLLAPALQYISLEFQNVDLSLQQVADECHISKIYLHKLFVQEFGITPFRYITHLRMERAKVLLQEKYPPKQVAKLVGYGDMYAFSRAYKRHFGVPPRNDYIK